MEVKDLVRVCIGEDASVVVGVETSLAADLIVKAHVAVPQGVSVV